MGFSSKAFAAQDALIAAIQDVPALSEWSKDFGLPSVRDELHLWVDEGVDQWEQEAGTTGLVSRNESFRIHVYLYARHTGATAQEVRNEINQAADVVADVIGSEPFLNGVVLYAQIMGAEYGGAFADPEGRVREGYLKITIGCDAFVA